MLSIQRIIYALFLFGSSLPALAQTQITICTDTNFWYPFTYVKNQKASGLHIDIIRTTLHNLGFEPIFMPTSWKECLQNAKLGIVDAVATASYLEERSSYLDYPEGAAVDRRSPWRVTQVGYRVITAATNAKGVKNSYTFEGDYKTIPQPVRVPVHYSVFQDLQKEGLLVKEGKNSYAIFKTLLKEKTGSIVDVEEVAKQFGTRPEFAGNLVIQKRPLNSKSYYLAFSKGGSIPRRDQDRIWKEMAKVRDNDAIMGKFLSKY